MRSGDNPYNPGAGTPPPKLAGRGDILQHAEGAIARAKKSVRAKDKEKKATENLMLLGLRGMGKTALLKEIEKIAKDAGCRTAMVEADADESLAKKIAPMLHELLCQLDSGKNLSEQVGQAMGKLWDFIAKFDIKLDIGILTVRKPPDSQDKAIGDLETDLTKLFVAIGEAGLSRGTVSLLLVDEMQFLSKKDLGALVMALHKISQERLPLLMFGAGLPQLPGIIANAKSYGERLFRYKEIKKLDDDSARLALVAPAECQKVRYDEGAVRTILGATEGYPYFLQLWGFHAWEAASASPITDDDAQEATRRATAQLNEGFFPWRLERLDDDRQRDYARAMAELMDELEPGSSTSKDIEMQEVEKRLSVSPAEAETTCSELIEMGIAHSPDPGRIAFTVPGFDEFLLHAWGAKR